MKRSLALCLALGGGLMAASSFAKGPRDLWFFAESPYMDDAAQLGIMTNVVGRAAAAGYTGLAFISGRDNFGNWSEISCRNNGTEEFVSRHVGLDAPWRMEPGRLARFKALKRCCDAAGIDFIPLVWSVGYDSPGLDDPNRVACWPSSDVPYVVRDGRAVFAGESVAYDAHALDNPCAGKTNRVGRWVSTVSFAVKPMRRYRVSAEVRTENLLCASRINQGVGFHAGGTAEDGVYRTYFCRYARMEPTQDWTPVDLDFHSESATNMALQVIAPWNEGGRFEVRNLVIEEAPVEYVVRRAGAPFVVRDAETGAIYVEGRDYAPVACLDRISFCRPKRPLELRLLPGSAIREGAKLRVSAYEPRVTFGVQYSSCLSNPELYDYLKRSAEALEREFGLQKWFLSLDEFRVGCRCELCERSGKSYAEMYAEAVTKMRAIIRTVRPDAEIFMWSDMVDPDHNGKKNYYHCRKTFEGALAGIPADIVMVPWWSKKAEQSVKTFSARGHEVIGGGFYDLKTLDKVQENVDIWLKALKQSPKARGILYTTWTNGRDGGNYTFLEDFARLVRENW